MMVRARWWFECFIYVFLVFTIFVDSWRWPRKPGNPFLGGCLTIEAGFKLLSRKSREYQKPADPFAISIF